MTRFWSYLQIATRALAGHKFRSTLTVLSITLGAFAIVLMTSLAESGLTTLMRGLEDLGGSRLILLVGKKPERAEQKSASYTRGLTLADRELLRGALSTVEARSLYAPLWRKDIVADSGVLSRTDFVVADAGFFELFKMKLSDGRVFDDGENREHRKLCVVGHKLAERLWPGERAVGRSATIAGVRCRVVGQLENRDRWGVNMGFDWLDVIVVPIDTYADLLPPILNQAELLMRTDSVESNDLTKRIINALLKERHNGIDDFEIIDFARFLKNFQQVFFIMKMIVAFIAAIALLVGGVGVMNMMLVSVSERVREIGIRKALGASPWAIGTQFLTEAVLLSGSGGAVGVGSGILLATIANRVIHGFQANWVGVIAEGAVIAALSVSLAIGVIFGFLPAFRAARLDPVEALRR